MRRGQLRLWALILALVSIDSHDGSEEVAPVLARSDLDLLDLGLHDVSPSGLPQALGHVHPAEGGALLSRVLEPGPDRLEDGLLDVCALVDEVEVLASRLSDDARVGSVEVDVVGDLLPESLEDGGRSGEVESGELLVVDALLDNRGSVSLRIARQDGEEEQSQLGQIEAGYILRDGALTGMNWRTAPGTPASRRSWWVR